MYLKCNQRRKDGKVHRYWSIMENRRCARGRVLQRPVLYLGEINDSQREAWIRSIEVFDEDQGAQGKLALFAAYRLIDPGSEWRMHRHWFAHSAMGDLLGEDDALAAKDTLYRTLDLLLPHKQPLFKHLTQRWSDLFGVKFEVLLYDLTSTYFESNPPFPEGDKRRYGYSRDKRSDCVQVVIALIVTPEGFPLVGSMG